MMIQEFEPDRYAHVWCLACERVAATEAWMKRERCPFCGAGGLDADPWLPDEKPRIINPEYPEVPTLGGWYPLCLDSANEASRVGMVPEKR